jgi:hypothetical protein
LGVKTFFRILLIHNHGDCLFGAFIGTNTAALAIEKILGVITLLVFTDAEFRTVDRAQSAFDAFFPVGFRTQGFPVSGPEL